LTARAVSLVVLVARLSMVARRVVRSMVSMERRMVLLSFEEGWLRNFDSASEVAHDN
jgi:hypothetical protein